MRVPKERRYVPAPSLASLTTNFSDSKCQVAVAVLHRAENGSIHRRDAEYERERVQRAPHTPIAVRPRFSMIEFTPPGRSTASPIPKSEILREKRDFANIRFDCACNRSAARGTGDDFLLSATYYCGDDGAGGGLTAMQCLLLLFEG